MALMRTRLEKQESDDEDDGDDEEMVVIDEEHRDPIIGFPCLWRPN